MINKNTNSSTSGWEKLMSHRRWSILSNTFNNNQVQQSGSIHSVNEYHPNIQCRHLLNNCNVFKY